MSQELLAIIGEKEVELKRLKTENASLNEHIGNLQAFIEAAAKSGKPLCFANPQELPVERTGSAESIPTERFSETVNGDRWDVVRSVTQSQAEMLPRAYIPEVTGELAPVS